MRLFSTFFFFLSQSLDDTVNEVQGNLGRLRQPTIKQTVPHAEAGSAVVGFGQTFEVPWDGMDNTRMRLLDLSVDKNTYVRISQNGDEQAVELKGSSKLPARMIVTLAPDVEYVNIESREATDDCNAYWFVSEYSSDITDKSNFPVV